MSTKNSFYSSLTRKSFDIGKQDTDVLVTMDVNTVELLRQERFIFGFARDISDDLPSDEIGQYCENKSEAENNASHHYRRWRLLHVHNIILMYV